ncbi:MAG TPA: COX15/CtaA family protein [Candidatus Binatia bacterium]|nr:COX15/CtaA family protein [Candidatus Binatia bacterium]
MQTDSQRLSSPFIPNPSSFSPWPHRLALVLAWATFPLLFIGGLVTSLGVGLAVPDWPTTFGYPMFLYPWSQMIGGIFYEHSHRLVASFVGLTTIALAVTFWLKERRRWLCWLGTAALGLVILQGILGGLRVVLLEQTLAIVHACLAQAFFALTVSLVLFTSSEWRHGLARGAINDGGRLRRVAVITTVLIYFQIIFGAILRHTGERLDGHLFFAALVAVHVILLLLRVTRFHGANAQLHRPAVFLGALLLLQFLLGAGAYFAKFAPLFPLPMGAVVLVTTTHLITGALMLVTSLALSLKAYRAAEAAPSALETKGLSEQYSV